MTAGAPAYIEVINFPAMAASEWGEIKVVGIKNPNAVRADCKMAVSIFEHNGATGIYNYLLYKKISVFLDIQPYI
jgi:hypothetical protein